MFGPNVPAIQAIGFILRVIQNIPARWTERQINASRDFRAALCPLFYRGADRLWLRPWQPSKTKHLLFAHQSQKQVICINHGRAELARFIPCEENYAPRLFRVPLEHRLTPKPGADDC